MNAKRGESMAEEQQPKQIVIAAVGTPSGRYDDRRCATCGVPIDEHTDECSRHEFIIRDRDRRIAEAMREGAG